MMEYEEYMREKSEKIRQLSELAKKTDFIEEPLYEKYNVKRGLRDRNGKGVVCGLTEISDIVSSKKMPDGTEMPCNGELRYRGMKIEDLVSGFINEKRFGFEEIIYLLFFGQLPDREELSDFCDMLANLRQLPTGFVRDVIMKAPSADMMNVLSRAVLTLYSYDSNPDDISIENVLRQLLQLVAQFPLVSVYGYHTKQHYFNNESLIIHHPMKNYSTAENILHMLRPDSIFTNFEARMLDLCLVLHAEHGGGNNSSFTTHVVTSSGADTYSTVAASLGSLKGFRHGGANIKVVRMMDDLKSHCKKGTDDEICDYLNAVLNKEAFDRSGLIFGMGHAVYSLSDPRATLLKSYAEKLADAKGYSEEYELFSKVERLAPQIIAEKRKMYKGVSANVDFYSGLIYRMLNLPEELFTPIFAISRIVGWGAHRMEEISNNGKIIRPGYVSVAEQKDYIPLDKRTK